MLTLMMIRTVGNMTLCLVDVLVFVVVPMKLLLLRLLIADATSAIVSQLFDRIQENNIRTLNDNDVCMHNMIQSEKTDFAPDTATWRTRRNLRVVSDSAYSLYYVKT